MLPIRWGWKPRAWVRSEPLPHLPVCSSGRLAGQSPQMPLQIITTRRRSHVPFDPLEAETTREQRSFPLGEVFH